MKKIIALFLTALLLTAVFSYSLKVFLKADFLVLTLKAMMIPCFTWCVLLLIAYVRFSQQKRLQYFTLAAWVCAIGSAVLVPAGIYNFFCPSPDILGCTGSRRPCTAPGMCTRSSTLLQVGLGGQRE